MDGRGLDGSDHREREGGSAAWGAFAGDVTAHEFGEVPADGEAEASAAIASRIAGVALFEGVEESLADGGVDSDTGVSDDPDHAAGLVGEERSDQGDLDLAVLGELDGITEEVEEDLTDSTDVADDCRGDFWVDPGDEIEGESLGGGGR